MTPKEAFNKAVTTRVGDNRNHGWGVDDSMAVIEAIWESETGDKMDASVKEHVKKVVNPSQFRQLLEKAKRPDGQTVLAESTRKRERQTLEGLYA